MSNPSSTRTLVINVSAFWFIVRRPSSSSIWRRLYYSICCTSI